MSRNLQFGQVTLRLVIYRDWISGISSVRLADLFEHFFPHFFLDFAHFHRLPPFERLVKLIVTVYRNRSYT